MLHESIAQIVCAEIIVSTPRPRHAEIIGESLLSYRRLRRIGHESRLALKHRRCLTSKQIGSACI